MAGNPANRCAAISSGVRITVNPTVTSVIPSSLIISERTFPGDR